MTRKAKLKAPKGAKRWVPDKAFKKMPARMQQAIDAALVLRRSPSNSPSTAWALGEAWRSGELEKLQHIKNKDDKAYVAHPNNLGCSYIFCYHSTPIVKVLTDIVDSPSPRVSFTLGGWNTKATRERLNRYAVILGVKFYCWQQDNQPWAIWVHDGDVFWEPMDRDDKIIATLY